MVYKELHYNTYLTNGNAYDNLDVGDCNKLKKIYHINL